MIKDALVVVGGVIQQQFLVFSPTLILGVLSTVQQVAVYNVAFKCSALFGMILIAGNSILSPNIAATHVNDGVYRIQNAVTQASTLMFVVALPLLIIMIMAPAYF